MRGSFCQATRLGGNLVQDFLLHLGKSKISQTDLKSKNLSEYFQIFPDGKLKLRFEIQKFVRKDWNPYAFSRVQSFYTGTVRGDKYEAWIEVFCLVEWYFGIFNLKKRSDFHSNPIHPSAYIFPEFSIWERVCVIFKLLLVAGYGQYAWSDKLIILSLVGKSVTQSRNQFALEKFLLQELKMFDWNWNGRRIQNVWSDQREK